MARKDPFRQYAMQMAREQRPEVKREDPAPKPTRARRRVRARPQRAVRFRGNRIKPPGRRKRYPVA